MFKPRIFFLSICLSLAYWSESSAQLVLSRDNPLGITVEVNKNNQVYYRHTLNSNETLFSLAKYFKVAIQDLLLINNIKQGDQVAVGTEIVIPIIKEEIHSPIKRKELDWIPMIYSVKQRETLYKLSNVYFPQKIENLITRNNIKTFSLPLGRKMVVGWWDGDGNISTGDTRVQPPHNDTNKKEDQIIVKNNDQLPNLPSRQDDIIRIDTIYGDHSPPTDSTLVDNEEVLDTIINYTNGLALWDKDGYDRTNLFVMHNKAKANSYIKLKYGVTGREIVAKVISRIPNGLYAEDIDIIITPAVADKLGALDSRFVIQMHYYE